ncbi:MAG: hypothetical protein GY940_22835, partial [bacterium]|nr:hypothetical protein [bacterium]
DFHPIICDDRSMVILFRELSMFYRVFSRAKPDEKETGIRGNLLPPLNIQYKDYTSWQNAFIVSSPALAQKDYWLGKLSGQLSTLVFPTDFIRPPVKTYNGSSHHIFPDAQVVREARKHCLDQDISPFILLCAALKILLYRYTGQEDIILGTLAADRVHPALENQAGFYVNTLALRSRVNRDSSVHHFLAQVKQTTVEAFAHQHYPFDCLVEQLNLPNDRSRQPLFDIMAVIQDTRSNDLNFDNIHIESFPSPINTSEFDMTFFFPENSDMFDIAINYKTDLFKPERIQRIGMHFTQLLGGIARDTTHRVRYLTLLGDIERQRVLNRFNDT